LVLYLQNEQQKYSKRLRPLLAGKTTAAMPKRRLTAEELGERQAYQKEAKQNLIKLRNHPDDRIRAIVCAELCKDSSCDEESLCSNTDESLCDGDVGVKRSGASVFDKLKMEFQGLNVTDDTLSDDESRDEAFVPNEDEASDAYAKGSMTFGGVTLYKHRCYRFEQQDIILGIKYFVSETEAFCVPVEPFEKTFLGVLQKEFAPDEQPPFPYVQNRDKGLKLHLKYFVYPKRSELDIPLPEWSYQQRSGMNFAYWVDTKKTRIGKLEKINGIDLYSGAGGLSAGLFKACIRSMMGVEKDRNAARAFLDNHGGLKDDSEESLDEFFHNCRESPEFLASHLSIKGNVGVWHGTVVDFLTKCRDDTSYLHDMGKIHYVHLSPPCQGF
jgi:hypothetical protein